MTLPISKNNAPSALAHKFSNHNLSENLDGRCVRQINETSSELQNVKRAQVNYPDVRPGSQISQLARRRNAIIVSQSSVFREAVAAHLQTLFPRVAAGSSLQEFDLQDVEPESIVVLETKSFDDTTRSDVAVLRDRINCPRILVVGGIGEAALKDFSKTDGLAALLSHDEAMEHITCAVVLAMSGFVSVPEQLLKDVSVAPGPVEGLENDDIPLSKRERDVLRCLARGRSNKHIARDLEMAEPTVRSHVRSILLKLNVQNRTQATVWALKHRSGTWL